MVNDPTISVLWCTFLDNPCDVVWHVAPGGEHGEEHPQSQTVFLEMSLAIIHP